MFSSRSGYLYPFSAVHVVLLNRVFTRFDSVILDCSSGLLLNEFLGQLHVISGLLERGNDVLKAGSLIFALSLEQLHGFLVEFNLIDFLLHHELDLHLFTKRLSMSSVETEYSAVGAFTDPSGFFYLDWDGQLEGRVLSDVEVYWQSHFIYLFCY